MVTAAILLAAGEGRRLGGVDKALLDLGGRSACAWLVEALREAGVDRIVVVRAPGAVPLPVELGVEVAVTSGSGDMLASLRAGEVALAGAVDKVFVSPVDHALVTADTLTALGSALDAGAGIALPLFEGRPGHPVALRVGVLQEIHGEVGSLRDVVRREPGRVRVVATENPWVVRDLDTPERVAQARAWLADG